MFRRLSITIGVCICASYSNAQAPMSAIDWLTESINNPPEFEPPQEARPIENSVIQEVFITNPENNISPDAIGLLSPSVTGLSANLWGSMSTKEVVKELSTFPNSDIPEAKKLFRRILLAQTNPPFDVSDKGKILITRIDKLIEMGALDAAEAMASQVQRTSPELFDRAFTIAALTDRTLDVCDALKEIPSLSTDLTTRIYCLARSGDWNAAAITLSLGAGIGAIPPQREEMLMRYLDPELFEGQPDPSPPTPLNPMDFVLREAVLLPRPAGALPLSYLYRDIGLRSPLRSRIEASERLVKAGAIPANLLFTAYRTGSAASSGGVWGRSGAIQKLDKALESGDSEKINNAILEATYALGEVDLLFELAEEYGPKFAEIDPDENYAESANIIFNLLQLAGTPSPAWAKMVEMDEKQALANVLTSGSETAIATKANEMVHAIEAAFYDEQPDTPEAFRLMTILNSGNQGQAILGALRLLVNGSEAEPKAIQTGLYILSKAGQDEAARRIALQILLLPEGSQL